MRALLSDPAPAEFEALLDRRRRTGVDRRDEVWQGVLHVNPAPHGRHAKLQARLLELLGPPARAAGLTALGDFNLGQRDDYRIPDAGLLGAGPDELYYQTAALAIEIVSPGDETWDKLPFYADHNVDELLIVDPAKQAISWLAKTGQQYEPISHSRLVDLSAEQLATQLDWPTVQPSP